MDNHAHTIIMPKFDLGSTSHTSSNSEAEIRWVAVLLVYAAALTVCLAMVYKV